MDICPLEYWEIMVQMHETAPEWYLQPLGDMWCEWAGSNHKLDCYFKIKVINQKRISTV
jgi:hypothetical protein